MIRPTLLAATVLLAACAAPRDATSGDTKATSTAAPTEAFAMLASRWPISPEQRPTTSESIFLHNLDDRIADAERRLATKDDPRRRAILAAALEHRFRITGRLADAERATTEIGRALAVDPAQGDAHLVQAGLHASFHRFDAARAALAQAKRHGADAAVVARLERDIDLALGRYDAMRDDFAKSEHLDPDFWVLAHRADLRASLGDLGGASRLYRAAQDLYDDVDPFPLAWLHTQQGIALLRFGDAANARRFFEAAHARMPSYVLAAEHLAETLALTGELEASRRLYLRVVEQTGNPEFVAALAGVEAQLGNEAEARRRYAEAARGYAALLARHREAYAQHAAEFHLERGNPGRAYGLAKRNAAMRRDVGSLILAAQAAEAVGRHEEACRYRDDAVATKLAPPELRELDTLGRSCRSG